MATLKIKKKTSETPKSDRAPVRRTDASKRDRTKARPPKPTFESENTRQRNHRHDGSLHQTESSKIESPDSNTPKDTPILRSEYQARDRSADTPRQTSSSVDDKPRSTYEPNPNARKAADREGAYRNPPRRGGKARDGFVASEFDKNHRNKQAFANKENSGQNDSPRLSKRMAELGLCSRREADEWITNGWVKVDGEIIDVLGTRISPDAEIIVSGYAKEHQAESVTILLNKPIGHVSGQAEDGYQPAIVLVHPDNEWLEDPELNEHNAKHFQRGFLQGLAPAGRLDIDSSGLLVLTQDGRIARHLIGENTSVEKEYLVRVDGELNSRDLAKLNHGLSLDGVALKPAKVSWQNEDQLRFVLREGKKRQIRRMCEMVGLTVVGLKRVRIGSVTLGKIPTGQWRYLRTDERF